jgi:3-oxoadipate enol-lactonase
VSDRSFRIVGATTLGVLEQGGGPPVLFLHGIGSSADAFARQFEALSDRYRCIAWDAPGYASSHDPVRPPGMDGYAESAAELLVGLDASPAHVVGVSWGGVIAVRLALRHPDRVRSLTLADSTRGSGVDPDRAAAMRQRGGALDESGSHAFAAARAPKLVSDAAPPALVDQVTASMASSIRNPGYRFAAEAMADTDHLADLGRIDRPTLVVVGEHDTVTGVDASRALAANIPGARLAIVPRAGHLSNQERPDHFNRLLAEFLDALEESTPAHHSSCH